MDNEKPIDTPKLTGKEIREFRRKYGMTQTEFGKLLDLSLLTVWRTEQKSIIADIIAAFAFYWLLSKVLNGELDILENPEAIEIARLTPETLRAKREQLGLSQTALARQLGVSFATVNRWENRHVDVGALLVVGMALEGLILKKEEEERAAQIKAKFGKMKKKKES
jgi:DNA-binding transcriptional regulator YiaG